MVVPGAGRSASRIFPAGARGVRDGVLPRARRRGADRARRSRRSRAAPSSSSAPAGRSRRTPSSPGSGSSRAPSWRRRPGCRSTTASSSTSTAASAAARTCSPRATSRASRCRRSAAAAASSTRTTRTPTAASSAPTWPARTSPYDHLPFFYSDLFDLGYEAVGEVDSRLATVERWRSRTGRASSRTSDEAGGRAASCSGTSGTRSSAARELIRAGEPVDEAVLV